MQQAKNNNGCAFFCKNFKFEFSCTKFERFVVYVVILSLLPDFEGNLSKLQKKLSYPSSNVKIVFLYGK